MRNGQAQSALEYMMTYGWAILIIVIVAAVLYSMGIFNPSSSASATVTGFAGLGSVQAKCLLSGTLAISFGNNEGSLINITRINSTDSFGYQTSSYFSVLIAPDSNAVVLLPKGSCSNASSDSVTVSVSYTIPGQTFPGPYFSNGNIKTTSVPTSKSFAQNYYLDLSGSQTGYVPPCINGTFNYNLNAITISAWVYNNGQGPYWQNIAEVFNSTAGSLLDIGVTSAGGSAVVRWNPPADVIQPSGGAVPIDTWTLVTGTWNAATNNLTIYVDGVQKSSATGDGTASITAQKFNIGGGYAGMATFNGYLSDIQVYSTALTSSEISTLYSEGEYGMPISNVGIISWWPLSGNANDYNNNNNGKGYLIGWGPS